MNDKFKGLGVPVNGIMSGTIESSRKYDYEHLIVHAGDEFPSDEPKEAVTFPIGLLPEWLQTIIREHAGSYGTPIELWSIAFLSGISAAAGTKMKVVSNNYTNYPQLWVMIVGSSGTGKSEAFRVAFRRLLEIDADRYAAYQADYQSWETSDKQGRPPRWEQSIISDTTPEALFNTIRHSGNGLTLYRDELSGWFSDFGRYNKSGEIGHYLSIFDNQTFSINRKKEQPQLIVSPHLNICGTIQPSVLSEVLGKNNFEQSGFAQRFLFLYPEFPTRKYQKTAIPSTQMYDQVIDKIVEYKGCDQLSLSDGAEKAYEDFFNDTEIKRSKSNDFWASVFSKAQIQVLRLALTVKVARLIDEPDTEISEVDMQVAIGMMEYFIHSLQRIKSDQGEPASEKKEMIIQIFKENPEASQTDIAKILGVSREYVNRTLRSQVTMASNPLQEKNTKKIV